MPSKLHEITRISFVRGLNKGEINSDFVLIILYKTFKPWEVQYYPAEVAIWLSIHCTKTDQMGDMLIKKISISISRRIAPPHVVIVCKFWYHFAGRKMLRELSQKCLRIQIYLEHIQDFPEELSELGTKKSLWYPHRVSCTGFRFSRWSSTRFSRRYKNTNMERPELPNNRNF